MYTLLQCQFLAFVFSPLFGERLRARLAIEDSAEAINGVARDGFQQDASGVASITALVPASM